MTGKRRLALVLVIKSIIFIVLVVINAFIEDNVAQLRIGPVLYILFNLLIFNTVFFLPLFLLKLNKHAILRRNLVRILVVGNSVLLWYFTIPEIYYLVLLILFDLILFELYLIRNLSF